MSDLHSLLPVTKAPIGGQENNAIDGRALHAFLGVGKVFAAWMPEQIEAFGFEEHRDFEVFSETGKNPQGGRPTREYMLSIDMAKELAMVQRSEKGKQARAYFLECERRLADPVGQLLRLSQSEMLEMALKLSREREALRVENQRQQQAIHEMTPKAEFHDKVAASSAGDAISIREFAKVIGTGQNRLFEWMRGQGFLIGKTTEPYQSYVDAGYFTMKDEVFEDQHGRDRVYTKTLVTPRGQAWIGKKWQQDQHVKTIGKSDSLEVLKTKKDGHDDSL